MWDVGVDTGYCGEGKGEVEIERERKRKSGIKLQEIEEPSIVESKIPNTTTLIIQPTLINIPLIYKPTSQNKWL